MQKRPTKKTCRDTHERKITLWKEKYKRNLLTTATYSDPTTKASTLATLRVRCSKVSSLGALRISCVGCSEWDIQNRPVTVQKRPVNVERDIQKSSMVWATLRVWFSKVSCIVVVFGEFRASRMFCSEWDIQKRPVTVERDIQKSSIVLVYSDLRCIVNWDYNGYHKPHKDSWDWQDWGLTIEALPPRGGGSAECPKKDKEDSETRE